MFTASKIAIATDLHLDKARPETVATFLGSLGGVQADIMLLAGDLSNRANYSEHLALLAREFGRPVILVRGNHDFFGGSMKSADACHARAIDEAGDVMHLNGDQVVEIADGVGIIGHDGWYDGISGLGIATPNEIPGLMEITEYRNGNRDISFKIMLARSHESAEAIARGIVQAARKGITRIIVLTHVPPFVEATRYNGSVTSDELLPFFCNAPLGEVLLAFSRERPDVRIHILCGHTHRASRMVLGNLSVETLAGKSGHPRSTG